MNLSFPDFEAVTEAQRVKGRIAAAVVILTLNDGTRVEDLPWEDDNHREIWREMHPVAHLWAACVDYTTPGDSAELCRRLLVAERLLDRMQARDDLRHPDPWRLSPEMRAQLEADPAIGGIPPYRYAVVRNH